MLKFAKLYEGQLKDTFMQRVTEPKFRFMCPDYLEVGELPVDDWDSIVRVSVCDGEIVGYMRGRVARVRNHIDNLSIAGFSTTLKGAITFEVDLLEYMKELFLEFHKSITEVLPQFHYSFQ